MANKYSNKLKFSLIAILTVLSQAVISNNTVSDQKTNIQTSLREGRDNESTKIVNINSYLSALNKLHNELELAGVYDSETVMTLLEYINTEILSDEGVKEHEKLDALNLANILTIKLKQLGKEDLKFKLSSLNSTEVLSSEQQLVERIYKFNEHLFEEIYGEVISEQPRDKLETLLRGLLKYTRGLSNIEQAVHGLITIFNEMRSNKLLYSSQIFNLAHHIKDIKEMDDYNMAVSDIRRRNVENILYQLPVCLRNMVGASQVCIRNNGRNEYLFAASGKKFLQDKSRRHVYTWTHGGKVGEGNWKMQHAGDDIYEIINTAHPEHLYAANFNFKSKMRYVFTWIPGNAVRQSRWRIELERDYCYLKNILWDEYLYATDKKKGKARRHVCTWEVKGKQEVNKYFGWVIENCS